MSREFPKSDPRKVVIAIANDEGRLLTKQELPNSGNSRGKGQNTTMMIALEIHRMVHAVMAMRWSR